MQKLSMCVGCAVFRCVQGSHVSCSSHCGYWCEVLRMAANPTDHLQQGSRTRERLFATSLIQAQSTRQIPSHMRQEHAATCGRRQCTAWHCAGRAMCCPLCTNASCMVTPSTMVAQPYESNARDLLLPQRCVSVLAPGLPHALSTTLVPSATSSGPCRSVCCTHAPTLPLGQA